MDFCKEIGSDSTTFANYELGRSPLPYDLANQICRRFGVSQIWLAEGIGLIYEGVFYDPGVTGSGNVAFSKIYDLHFQKFASLTKVIKGLNVQVETPILIERINELVSLCSESQGVELVNEISRTLNAFCRLHKIPKVKIPGKLPLDKFPKTENCRPVPHNLTELLERARLLTNKRGMRSALARKLSVSASRITDWLAGSSEPNGDATLRLLNWVEEQEVEQKTPGSAANTAKGKQTQRKQSDERKPTSGPP